MDVVNRDRVEPFITRDTSEVREILSPRNSHLQNQSLAEATLAPGRATQEHYHPRAEEIYYILQGWGGIRVDNRVEKVGAGDGIAILPGQRHKIWNTGEADLVFLCCCAPAYRHEDTVITD